MQEDRGTSNTLSPVTPHVSTFRRYKRMNIRFKLPYYTVWGQNLVLCGSEPQFGGWSVKSGVWMTPHHEGEHLVWQALVSVPEDLSMEYRYCLVDEKMNVIKWEGQPVRLLKLPGVSLPDGASVDVLDQWQDGSSPESLLVSPAFRNILLGQQKQKRQDTLAIDEQPKSTNTNHSFQSPLSFPKSAPATDCVWVGFSVSCSLLSAGQKVYVSGSCAALGSGQAEAAMDMQPVQTQAGIDSGWEAYVLLKHSELPIKYRYLLKDKQGNVEWERGEDMELAIDASARRPSSLILLNNNKFRGLLWRGAGLAFPVFSLRSRNSVGSGDFVDLKLAVDLAVAAGMRLLQLLPVNDTSVHGTWWDSYPYSSLSVFALHPLYLRLQSLSDNVPSHIQEEVEAAKQQLNAKEVDYEATMRVKLSVAKKMYFLEKQSFLQSAEFKAFFEENKSWLKPYAAFCFLRDVFGTADHSQWGAHSQFSQQKLERLVQADTDHFDSIAFRYYLQFHLCKQLSESSRYAHAARVLLKGDLPIGVDPHSVDTWQFPSLFHLDSSTGAPPDQFDPKGQNWGFPTYNWEAMAKDNYAWWRARLTQLSKFFSVYRIDHILGFFRIWELPSHAVLGITGHFRPSLPITAEELEVEGLWDFNRLTEPYITESHLQELFASVSSLDVASKYFTQVGPSTFKFKPLYDTEKKIVASLALDEKLGEAPPWLKKEVEDTKQGLLTLVTNVCLLRDSSDPRKFYPRFNMDKTSSFAALDEHTQRVLQRVYQDYYFVRQEALWRSNALKTLPVMLNSSPMLTCGEDLGFVPACVPPVLQELGLLGLRIQRMPTTAVEFADPADYDYMTVCAPSCHDCSPMRAWWEEDKARRQRFFRTMLGGNAADAPDSCTPAVSRAIIQQHCQSPSVWAIFPMQDVMALHEEYCKRPAKEETINDPTNSRHYWRFRLHVYLEDMLKNVEFVGAIQELLVSSGRTTVAELPSGVYFDVSTRHPPNIHSLNLQD